MDWINQDRAIGFIVGVLVGIAYFVWDWLNHDYIRPWRQEKKRAQVLKDASNKKAEQDRVVMAMGGQVEPEVSVRAPLPPAPSAPEGEPATAAIEQQRGPATSDLPTTQAHPAPSTSMIDFRQPPPPRPGQTWQPPEKIGGYMSSGEPITELPKVAPGPGPGGARPYTGPERRLRSDNPYPELRRRAEDRERQEAEDAQRPAPPPLPAEEKRLTRAEERRKRERGELLEGE
jgi:hypothetical protein